MKTMREEVFGYMQKKYKSKPEYLWARFPEYAVFRHADNQKWFGLLMNLDRRLLEPDAAEEDVDVLNLKADESRKDAVLGMTGVYPAYHMNHDGWLTILLDGTVPIADITPLLDMSFELTMIKSKKKNE